MMEFYTKETVKALQDKIESSSYYMPKALFGSNGIGNVRLEAKMAYVAILDTLVKKPSYDKEGKAFIKLDNPEIANTLATLANKEVNQEKVKKYIEELDAVDLITVNKQDILVTMI